MFKFVYGLERNRASIERGVFENKTDEGNEGKTKK